MNQYLFFPRWKIQTGVFFSIFLVFTLDGFCGNLEAADVSKKRRRHGRGGKGDFEIFKDNLDLFAGPSINRASGDFITYPKEFHSSSNSPFKSTISTKTSTIYFTVGAQYRRVLDAESDNFLQYLSIGAGFMYQRRGVTQDLVLVNKNVTTTDDKINITDKYRAHYFSIPLTGRIGKKVFGEVGVTADFLLSGVLNREMARTYGAEDTIGAKYFATSYLRDYNTASIQPKISLGYFFGGGYEFTENIGLRFIASYNSKYFTEGKDFKNLQISLQLIGTIN